MELIIELLRWFKDVDDSTMDLLKYMITKTTKNLSKKLKREDSEKYYEGIEEFKRIMRIKENKNKDMEENENENFAKRLFIIKDKDKDKDKDKQNENEKDKNKENADDDNEENKNNNISNIKAFDEIKENEGIYNNNNIEENKDNSNNILNLRENNNLFDNNKNENKSNLEKKKTLKDEEEKYKYFIFDFEEFLLVFLRLIRFIIGIEARAEFYENNELFIYLHMDKKIFPIVAEAFDYELQCKPYAKMFRTFTKAKRLKGKNNKLNFKEEEEILVKILKSENKFTNLEHSNHLDFPPYFAFERNNENKFRRYNNDDEFHYCYRDPEFRPYKEINLYNEPNYDSPAYDTDDLENEDDFLQYRYDSKESSGKLFYFLLIFLFIFYLFS